MRAAEASVNDDPRQGGLRPTATRPAQRAAPPPLSARQRRLLTLLSRGDSNRRIGEQLALGEGTVKNYVSTLMLHLGARNRAHLAAIAVATGLVVLDTPITGRPIQPGVEDGITGARTIAARRNALGVTP